MSNKIQVLNVFNSILLIKEEDPSDSDSDILRVIDIVEVGGLLNKYLFSAKIKRQNSKTISMQQLKK